MRNINILGTEYEFSVSDLNNIDLGQNDGVCKLYDKKIIIRATEYMGGDSAEARELRTEHVVRHELVHAVAQECGVSYGDNEELVDWIAHIIPIVNKAFDEINKGLAPT